jgi:hypothetical protein
VAQCKSNQIAGLDTLMTGLGHPLPARPIITNGTDASELPVVVTRKIRLVLAENGRSRTDHETDTIRRVVPVRRIRVTLFGKWARAAVGCSAVAVLAGRVPAARHVEGSIVGAWRSRVQFTSGPFAEIRDLEFM